MKVTRQRIDKILTERGLLPSRERAQSYIMAGKVWVNEKRVEKASETYLPEISIEIKGEDHPYVSRGGLKLEGALKDFDIDVKGWVCLDLGASTGGFTDCLLQNGAKKVYAADVGYGQLAWKLRQDPRVIVWEKTHAKDLKLENFSEALDFVVIDVSFISLLKVLPHVLDILQSKTPLLTLIKPQFEADKGAVPRGGVIKDEVQRQQIVERVIEGMKALTLQVIGISPARISGTDGNQEFLALIQKS